MTSRLRRAGRSGLSLSELLLVLLGLGLVLGLVVSLARRVRREASHRLAERVLIDLERSLADYARRNGGAVPAVVPLLPSGRGEPAASEVAARALRNNRQAVAALDLRRSGQDGDDASDALDALGLLFDGETLRDPYGTPIAFLAGFDPRVGMAGGDRPFFVSAGPDGDFLTRGDNLYSYEAAADPVPPVREVDSP